jgi:GNAT superfamily N-acetyltransferase
MSGKASNGGLIGRLRALEHGVHESATTRSEAFDGGVAYFTPELPIVWDLNFLRLDRPADDPGASAERLQEGYPHRKVLVEDPMLVPAAGAALTARGFRQSGLIALAREPGAAEPDSAVREVGYRQVQPLREAIISEQMPVPLPDLIDQVTRGGQRWERAGARWFVLEDEGRPAAHCIVYSHEGLLQIEDVATLEAHRRRGLSRRLLRHVLDWAARDHDMTFILAEADDWPVTFYMRLGYEAVEERAQFTLIKSEASGAD